MCAMRRGTVSASNIISAAAQQQQQQCFSARVNWERAAAVASAVAINVIYAHKFEHIHITNCYQDAHLHEKVVACRRFGFMYMRFRLIRLKINANILIAAAAATAEYVDTLKFSVFLFNYGVQVLSLCLCLCRVCVCVCYLCSFSAFLLSIN